MNGIFISYRRHDSAGWTGRLSERMEHCFGPEQIFMDIEKIEAGTDFVDAIESAVGSCGVLLAIIGPAWLTSTDADGNRRLDNPDDFIRLEVATALNRNIRVIPVLVGGALMPASSDLPDQLKPLTRRQAHELSDNRWDYDTEQLVKIIENTGIKRKHEVKPEPVPDLDTQPKFSKKAISSLALSALTAASMAQENNIDPNAKTGMLALGLTALGLAVFAYFDIKLKKSKSKGLAVTALAFSGLILLMAIGLLSTPSPIQPVPPQPHQGATQQNTPVTVPAETQTPQQQAPQPASAAFSGLWTGSDGMFYTMQQQGNMVTVVGGYPNLPLTVNATGSINGRSIDMDYIRTTDNTGGKAQLRLSADGRTLKGRYQNIVTGETGELLLNR